MRRRVVILQRQHAGCVEWLLFDHGRLVVSNCLVAVCAHKLLSRRLVSDVRLLWLLHSDATLLLVKIDT